MRYRRMPIEIESPEQLGYDSILYNLCESSVTDARWSDLKLDLGDLVLAYGDHFGKPELRALLTHDYPPLQPDHVLLTIGAAAALFIISTSLLQPGDHMLVVYPNYATNVETPRQIGADYELFQLSFDRGYQIDIDALIARIRPNTRLVSITVPHNPTGATVSQSDLFRLIQAVESRGCLLLVDETYREMAYDQALPPAASLSPSVISVSSLSKTYGLPGIRLGWLMTQNAALMPTFLAAKEQIFISGSVLDEEVAYRYLLNKDTHLARIRSDIARKLAIVQEWVAEEALIEWVEPRGGVACFPRIKADVNVDLKRFYDALNGKYRTMVGPGHWFEQDDRHMRIGFGWPSDDQLRSGLENISHALRDTLG
ncbi:MAG TPA: aminotransferase class I/II-fold pyridoxal phosphate-dependent enzyme [Phototrophicaceae bacterium]|nr:aminotransferase class I/II-fold pyridoxal phosphate-dependent enzyme [Phototrophicaceae bacterium]